MNPLPLNHLPLDLKSVLYHRDLAVGEILFTQGEPSEAIFVVELGCILLMNYTDHGQQINHYSVRAGEMFAELVLFKDSYVCSAIASAPSRVLVLPKSAFLRALNPTTDLAAMFMAQLAKRLHESKLLLDLRSIRSAPQRVLHYLRLMSPAPDQTIVLDRPLKEIAYDLGLTPESLSRALKHLQGAGAITRKQRQITFHQP